jgi:hypothetical protein
MVFYKKNKGISTEYSFFLNIFCKVAAKKNITEWIPPVLLLAA